MKITKSYRLDEFTIRNIEELAKKYNLTNTEVIEKAVMHIFHTDHEYERSKEKESKGYYTTAEMELHVAGFRE